MSGRVSVRLLMPEALLAHIEQARRRAALVAGKIEGHGHIWSEIELLELVRHLRIGLDELGQALNHQRAVERRAAKRTLK